MNSLRCGLVSALACLGLVSVHDAQAGRALDGAWGVRIVQPRTGCTWVGHIRLTEQAGHIAGRGLATPSAESHAPARCPRLEGDVLGQRRGDIVSFGFATGRLGQADFEGRLDGSEQHMHGTWRTRAAAGQWSAGR
jgi:hypothetical protein